MNDHEEANDQDTPTGTEWLTLAEAGDLVGRSARTIRRLVKEGKIRGREPERGGAPWYVDAASVTEHYGPARRPGPAPTRELVPTGHLHEWAESFRAEAESLRGQLARALEDAARWRGEVLRVEALLSKRQWRRLRELRDDD